MIYEDIISKITEKKEFSSLPLEDVEKVLALFPENKFSDLERIKLSRNFLRKMFSSFSSYKLFSERKKILSFHEILRKHLSTRERLPYYEKVYSRIFRGLGKRLSIIDLGSGVNGFSYEYFSDLNLEVNYSAIEGVGQLVNLMNSYFIREKISGKATHGSLFDLKFVKDIVSRTKRPKVVFLFKVIDSLEMLERDYSKKLLLEIVPLSDRVVISFATKSFVKRKTFYSNRRWFVDFLKENFNLTDDFIFGGERYLVVENNN